MKSICDALRQPVVHHLKKNIVEGSLRGLSTLSHSTRIPEVEDKIDLAPDALLRTREQMSFYKPSNMQQKYGLVYKPVANFSNLTKPRGYAYSSITGGEKTIDVTNDYVFKGIFTDEERAKDFLESVLIGKGKIFPEDTKIQELEYLKNEHIQNKAPEDAKKIIFDLQIKTNKGIFIIEMQKNATPDYLKRVEFYNATAYSHQQIKEGTPSMKDYTKALPIVTISLINGKMFPDQVPCVSYHTNVERKTQEQYMKAFAYVFIELEKFNNDKYDQDNITTNEKDWLLFMKTQDLNQKYSNEHVNNAVKYVQDIRDNKYEEYTRYQMSELAAQKEKEYAQTEVKIEIARGMIKEGDPDEKISKITKLPLEEVKKLREEETKK